MGQSVIELSRGKTGGEPSWQLFHITADKAQKKTDF